MCFIRTFIWTGCLWKSLRGQRPAQLGHDQKRRTRRAMISLLLINFGKNTKEGKCYYFPYVLLYFLESNFYKKCNSISKVHFLVWINLFSNSAGMDKFDVILYFFYTWNMFLIVNRVPLAQMVEHKQFKDCGFDSHGIHWLLKICIPWTHCCFW